VAKAPAFQFYPDKWMAGTMHLSPLAYTTYHRLLCAIWLHEKTQYRFTFSPDYVCLHTSLEPQMFQRVWAEIQNPKFPLFKKKGKYLWSEGLRKEAMKQKDRRQKARESANARWNPCERNANACQAQCSPSPSSVPSPSSITNDNGTDARARASKKDAKITIEAELINEFCIRFPKSRWSKAKLYQGLKDQFVEALARGTTKQALIEQMDRIMKAGNLAPKAWEVTDPVDAQARKVQDKAELHRQMAEDYERRLAEDDSDGV